MRTFDWHCTPAGFQTLHHLIRKLAHVCEYAILAVLLYGWFRSSRAARRSWVTALLVVLVAGIYSLTDEFHQSFVPSRGASLRDCAIDTAGATAGLLGYFLLGAMLMGVRGRDPVSR